jgi:hypothetical protein
MADRKGRKENVQTIGSVSRPGKPEVTPLRPAAMQTPQYTAPKPQTKKGPTQEQIAERAWALWVRGGCMPGQDRQNWFEAERQLRAELGVQG